jgi:phosphoglycerate dehydrogenase-like enzyme
MRNYRIAVLDDFQNVALHMADWSVLAAGSDVTVFNDNIRETADVVERLAPFDIVVAMRERTPLPRERLERLPNLKLLVTTGMWNSAIDMQAASERNVTVCGTESSREAPVELTWAMILGLARNIVAEDEAMRRGDWQTHVGIDLHGLTLGILGLGRLGIEVARIGKAFGMQCIAWSQNLTPSRCAEIGVTYAGKDAFFRTADVLSLHVVLSERTRHIVGAQQLALMKPEALLINTSRGGLVDTNALVAMLHEGRLGGAAIDVYDEEPLPADHPIRTAPRTLLTPHIGITTKRNYRLYYSQIVEDIVAFQHGAPIRVLNP